MTRRRPFTETALGDLREEFAEVSAIHGPRHGRAWYRRQVFRLASEQALNGAGSLASATHALLRPSGDHQMRSFIREIRLAVRSLRRAPLVNALIVLTLALGLGANAATFGLIDRLLLHPFPFEGVEHLVVVAEDEASDPFPMTSVAPANFLEWREQLTTVERLSATNWWDVNLSGGDRPERVQGHRVSADFFPLLGITAAMGRVLSPQDEVWGQHRQVVVGDGLWRRRFEADPGLVGRTIQLDGESFQVVGIAPVGFDFPSGTEVWAPLSFEQPAEVSRSSRYLTVTGRLRDGATLEDVRAELTLLFERQQAEHAEDLRDRRTTVKTFTAGMVDVGMPQVLLLWQVAAGLVLLIGCVNIANLLLARGADRQRELAVRLAIGAGRGHVVRQLLAESLVLAIVAVPAALAVAWASFLMLKAAMPAAISRFIPGWTELGVDPRVATFTAGAAGAAALLFGLLPAFRASRPALSQTLRDGGRSATDGPGRSRLRRGLVIAQVTIALPLLVLSSMSVVGIQRFTSGPQGYNPEGVVRVRTRLPPATYPDVAARRAFADRLLVAADGLAGAEFIATATTMPSSTSISSSDLVVDGVPPAPGGDPTVNYRAISPDYLRVMQIPLVQGRHFTTSDREDSERVTLVSQSLARRHWPDGTAVGHRVKFDRASDDWFTVVGIVGDTIDDWFAYRNEPTAYVPAAQAPSTSVYLVARASGDPAGLADGLRAAVAAVDPAQAIFDVATMPDAIRERTTGLRFVASLMLVFGILALTLATFGLYGVMAHHVAQRRHEIGVRMALGASGAMVLRQTIAQGAWLAGIGIVLGLSIGVALGSLMERSLFGIVAIEPWLFAGVAGAMALVAIVATAAPARQATRVDPMIALRGDG
jgi:predicted permease